MIVSASLLVKLAVAIAAILLTIVRARRDEPSSGPAPSDRTMGIRRWRKRTQLLLACEVVAVALLAIANVTMDGIRLFLMGIAITLFAYMVLNLFEGMSEGIDDRRTGG